MEEPRMIKFPSIEQARQVLPAIIRSAQFTHVDAATGLPCYDTGASLPVLEFRGTVKLHGSNAAVVQTRSIARRGENKMRDPVHFQSRERILSVEKDLMGFCAHMASKMDAVETLFDLISRALIDVDGSVPECGKGIGGGSRLGLGSEPEPEPLEGGGRGEEKGTGKEERDVEAIAVFGEWCGTGIQKGVALSRLPKMFVIFAIQIVYASQSTDSPESKWLDITSLTDSLQDERARIFNIMQFPTYRIAIDFNDEESLLEGNKKMEEWTLHVEEECPVGKHFGVSGVGEGIVWQAICNDRYAESRYWYKTKGLKHASYRKPKPAGIVGKPDAAKAVLVDRFVELVVSEGRLQQGLQVLERELLLPLEVKSVGAFIKWIQDDVMKEEYDRIKAAGLDEKCLRGPICAAAKKWYTEQLLVENLGRLKLERET
jgi:RNA ligase